MLQSLARSPCSIAVTLPSEYGQTKLSTDRFSIQHWYRQANAAKLLINEGVYTFTPLKFRRYWTESYQCKEITADESSEIITVIFQAVLES